MNATMFRISGISNCLTRFHRVLLLPAVAATLAIAASAPGFTIPNPSSDPRLVQQIGGACDISLVHGNLLLAAEGPSLRLFDLSDPAAPMPLGSVRLPGRPLTMEAEGTRCFMACGPAGVQIVDIGDPSRPIIVGSYVPGQDVMGISIEDIPAEGKLRGFAIVDRTAAGIPASLHALRFNDTPVTVTHTLVPSPGGDPRQPENHVILLTEPILVGQHLGLSDPRDLAVEGQTIFVANGGAGVELLQYEDRSITDTLIARIGAYATNSPALGVDSLAAQGIIIVNNREGLEFVGVSDPASPMSKGFHTMPGGAEDATAYGGTMILAAGEMGVQLLIVNDIPGADVELKFIDTLPTLQQAIAVRADPASGLMVAAQHDLGFELFDIGEIAMPQNLLHHLVAGNPRGIVFSAEQRGIIIVNNRGWANAFGASMPFSPMLTRTFPLGDAALMPPDPRAAALQGNLLLVADAQQGLILFNAVKYMAPTYQSTFPTRGAAMDVAVMGDLAYVAENGSAILEIVDISDPTSPTFVGDYDGAGEGHAVFVDGDYAYLAAGTGGLQVVDVSNPAMPRSDIAHKVVPPDEAFDVHVAKGLAYLAVGPGGLLVLDMFDPTGEYLRARHPTPASALSVVVAQNMVIVGTEGGGGVLIGPESAAAEQDALFDIDGNVGRLSAVGEAVYALTEDHGMWVYDFRTATRPSWSRYR